MIAQAARVAVLLLLFMGLANRYASTPAAAGTSRFVDDSATGANNGTSWVNAFTSLSSALAVATTGDTINVAKGTYKPTAASDRAATFLVDKVITILGGYPDGGGALRAPLANPTILSGEVGLAKSTADNSYHVVTVLTGAIGAPTLDGLTITLGRASGPGTAERGGGLYARLGQVKLKRMTFRSNVATGVGGGAIHGRDLTIEQSTFESNQAPSAAGHGGAIYATAGVNQITNATFLANTSGGSGGGVYANGGLLDLNYTTFSDNVAPTAASAALAAGTLDALRSIFYGSEASQLTETAGATFTVTDATIRGGCPAAVTCTRVVDVDPQLKAPADNGGNVETMALPMTSPAIDAIALSQCAGISGDARGFSRGPDGNGNLVAGCDFGAFERLPPPRVSFVAASSSISEAAGEMDVAVDVAVLTTAEDEAIPVEYSVAGTATGGDVDFILPLGPLTIPAGETAAQIHIVLNDDTIDEAAETIVITLISATNAIIVAETVHTVTITDNDAAPTVQFDDSALSASEGTGNVGIAVDLSQPSGKPITVAYEVTGGTATSGSDFILADGTLSVAAGDTSGDITVALKTDLLTETDETVVLTISGPVNATLGPRSTHTLTITDGPARTVQFALVSSSVSEKTASARVAVELGTATSATVKVDYSVTGGSATGGIDFVLANGTLSFSAGQTSNALTLAIKKDFAVEPNETVVITLASPSNAVLGPRTKHTLTIANDDSGSCKGKLATLAGTAAGDRIIGTAGNDVIAAKGGNDTINGGGGSDTICAGAGNDFVAGGVGDDRVFGDRGTDVLRGGPGADELDGGGGNDGVKGGNGNDTLRGGGGTDNLDGQSGEDRLAGGPGKGDRCSGGPGRDSRLPNHGCEVSVSIP